MLTGTGCRQVRARMVRMALMVQEAVEGEGQEATCSDLKRLVAAAAQRAAVEVREAQVEAQEARRLVCSR